MDGTRRPANSYIDHREDIDIEEEAMIVRAIYNRVVFLAQSNIVDIYNKPGTGHSVRFHSVQYEISPWFYYVCRSSRTQARNDINIEPVFKKHLPLK